MSRPSDTANDRTNASTDHACVGCDSDDASPYDVILDDQQRTTLYLCDTCHDRCYDSVLDADWVEAA